MILTREKRGNGQAGIFCRSIGLVAVMLAALLPASPAWSQEEKVAAPAGALGTPGGETAEKPLLWMPDAISTYGQGVDDLFWLIFWITGVAWVVVMGLMLYFLIRYRHVEGRDKAHYTHGNNKLEVTWTLATVVILVFILKSLNQGVQGSKSWV